MGLLRRHREGLLREDVAGIEPLLGQHMRSHAPAVACIGDRLEQGIGAAPHRQGRGMEVQGVGGPVAPALDKPGVTGHHQGPVRPVGLRQGIEIRELDPGKLHRDAMSAALGHDRLVVIVEPVAGPGEQLDRSPSGFHQRFENASEEIDAGEGKLHEHPRGVVARRATLRMGPHRLHGSMIRLT